MRPRHLLPIFLFIFIVSSSPSPAGRLYARLPGTASPLYNLRIENIRTSIRIENLLAITHVDEEFRNPQSIDLEGFYVFQLPEGALVDGLWLWVDGKRQTFIVKRLEEAKQIYDSVVHRGIGEPAILQTLGANRFQFKIFPIKAGSSRRIEMEYFHTLTMSDAGTTQYYYPLNLAGYQDDPVNVTAISIDIHADFVLDSVRSNFDSLPLLVRTQFLDTSTCHIDFGIENSRYTQDLVISFSPRRWFDTFAVMSYALPDTVTDGFFMMWNPVKPDPGEQVKSDFVFVLDASGSMTGKRLDLIRTTFKEIISTLQPYDRFKLVAFSDQTVLAYPSDTSMYFAIPGEILNAQMLIDFVYKAVGVTSYEAGIRAGMSTNFRREADHRMIFVTDGLPNAGIRSAAGLASIIKTADSSRMRFFPVSMYTDRIDSLHAIAQACSGKLTTIEQGDDVKTIISRLAFDFGAASIEQVLMTFPDSIYQTYPAAYPPSTPPEHLLSAGRCIGQGVWPVTLHCVDRRTNSPLEIRREIAFMPSMDEPVQVARYWAALRIRQLLDDLKAVTDSAEIKESIVRLSEKFMILSPFTAFLVVHEVDRPGGNTLVETMATTPETVQLLQNYPNPFHPGDARSGTMISIAIPESYQGERHASIIIYDASGREITSLWNGTAPTGTCRLHWDGRSKQGSRVPPGVYLCVLRMGSILQAIRIIVL